MPIEVTYRLPIDPDFIVSKLRVECEDRVIDGRVKSKSEARNQYDDTIGRGNIGVLVKQEDKDSEFLKMDIGNILSGQQVIVKVEVVADIKVEMGAYTLRVPTYYTPRSQSGLSLPGTSDLSFQVSYNFKLDCSSDITYFSYPTGFKLLPRIHAQTAEIIKQGAEGASLQEELVIYFKTVKMQQPMLLLQESAKHPDEVACMVTFTPTFDAAQKEQIVVQGVKPEQKQIEMKEQQFFTFIVDRSGSMQLKKIDIAIKLIQLFLSILPKGSKFNIIGFGSQFESLNPNGLDVTPENIQLAKDAVSRFKPNLGPANAYEPLCYALQQELWSSNSQSISKKIFLLTHGDVGQPDAVVKLSKKAEKCDAVIHTFGIGRGSNKTFVREVAKKAKGMYYFVEGLENLQQKVLDAFLKATLPVFEGCQVMTNVDEKIASSDGMFGTVHRNQFIKQLYILPKSTLPQLRITFLSSKSPFTGKKFTQSFIPNQAINLPNGEELFKMAVKSFITAEKEQKYSFVDFQRLSIDYQLLDQSTAIVGTVKQKRQNQEELRKIDIPILSKRSQKSSRSDRTQLQSQNNSRQLSRRNLVVDSTREIIRGEGSQYRENMLPSKNKVNYNAYHSVKRQQTSQTKQPKLPTIQVSSQPIKQISLQIYNLKIGSEKDKSKEGGSKAVGKEGVLKRGKKKMSEVNRTLMINDISYVSAHPHALQLMSYWKRVGHHPGYQSGFRCDICQQHWMEDSWSCMNCQFDICISCNKKENNKEPHHQNHPHPLLYMDQEDRMKHNQGYQNGFECDACGVISQKASWQCKKCNFDLCLQCHMKYKVKHPSYLHEIKMKNLRKEQEMQKQQLQSLNHQPPLLVKGDSYCSNNDKIKNKKQIYKLIMESQNYYGFWNKSFLLRISDCFITYPPMQKITQQLTNMYPFLLRQDIDQIISTFIVLQIFEMIYSDKKKEWCSCAQKAIKYIQTCGINKEQATQYIQPQLKV